MNVTVQTDQDITVITDSQRIVLLQQNNRISLGTAEKAQEVINAILTANFALRQEQATSGARDLRNPPLSPSIE